MKKRDHQTQVLLYLIGGVPTPVIVINLWKEYIIVIIIK